MFAAISGSAEQLARENAVLVRVVYPAIIVFVTLAATAVWRYMSRKIGRLLALNQKVLDLVREAPRLDETIRRLDAAFGKLDEALVELRAAVQVDGVSIQDWAAEQRDRWDEHDRTRQDFRDSMRTELSRVSAELQRLERLIVERVGPRRFRAPGGFEWDDVEEQG